MSISKNERPTQKKKYNYCYFRHITSDDMSSPRKVNRKWHIAQQTVKNRRKENLNLEFETGTFDRKRRLFYIKSLLKLLLDNQFITENAETVLKAIWNFGRHF